MNNYRLIFRLPVKCHGCGNVIYGKVWWDGFGFSEEHCHCDCGCHKERILEPEQCTGYLDKNDELIYKGDILVLENNRDNPFEVTDCCGELLCVACGEYARINSAEEARLYEITGKVLEKEN